MNVEDWPIHDTDSLRKYLIKTLPLKRYDAPLGDAEEADHVIVLSDFLGAGDLVGKGKYGDVCKAVWINTPATATRLPEAAIKLMRVPPFTEEKKRQKRIKQLKREVKVWQSLCHKNVLPFIGIAFFRGDPNQPCLVSRFMENGNLMDFLDHNPWEPTGHILVEIASGLEYLHSKGIVHGDLKGDNIVVDKHGNIYICDFGLSRMMDGSPLFQTSATHAGGTVRWSAPELIKGDQVTVTKQSDIYAYAMTAFQVTSGQVPYANKKTEAAVIYAILDGQRQERSAVPTISAALWTIWTQCWNSQPALRPSADQILAQISSLEDFTSSVHSVSIPTTSAVTRLAFSPDGETLISGHSNGKICLWKSADGTAVREISTDGTPISSVAFSSDGSSIACGSARGAVRICGVKSRLHVSGASMHGEKVRSVVFSPDGSWVASCSGDGSVIVWDTRDGEERARFECLAGELHVSDDGHKLVAIQETGVTVWDPVFTQQTGRRLSLWNAGKSPRAAILPNGNILTAYWGLKHITIYDLVNDRVIYESSLGLDESTHAVSRSGLVACDFKNAERHVTRLFNVHTGHRTDIHTSVLASSIWGSADVVFTGDGKQIAVAVDGRIIICNSGR